MDCLFCKMIKGDIVTDIVYQNDHIFAFRDINAQAPTHILIIPKKHISTVNDLTSKEALLIGEMTLAAQRIAEQEGLSKKGYRLITNCNEDGGQTVFHLHMHLMGGRRLQWPPG